YAAGAVVAGLLAAAFGLSTTVIAGGALTFASGLLAARWITGSKHPGTADAGTQEGGALDGEGGSG
ncbi:MAG TPA: hypothetical protein VGQ26_06995, partial [Streptosporangiaceae bacterium]|nr:hypothetical protein [Streptosporangiaceae bacterium]